MTLREHIDNIGEMMLAKGAFPERVLFNQLYLICLGLEGFHGDGIRAARHEEPFETLNREVGGLWGLTDQYDDECQGLVDQYLSNEDLTNTTPPEEFINTFKEILTKAARNFGRGFDHLQPSELSDLVYRLSGYEPGKTVYNPFAGVASYSVWFNAGDNYYGEEFDKITWGIGVLTMWITNTDSCNYVLGDSLNPKWKKKFDIVVSTPPMGSIQDKTETFADHLFASLPSLLKKDGKAVVVATMRQVIGPGAKRVVESGMLDAVIALPRSVFYWASLPPVILRFRANKREDDPIVLVDGTSFCKPGGRMTNIIDAGDIYRAVENVDPNVALAISPEEIARNYYRLLPFSYLQKAEVNADGVKMIPLSALGTFTKSFKIPKGNPDKGIGLRELTSDITDMYSVVPKKPRSSVNSDVFGNYRLVDVPALLIGGVLGTLKFAYITKPPVHVRRDIIVFIPDERIVDKNYLVYALSKAESPFGGSSLVRLTTEELSLIRIPVPSLREQKAIINKTLKEEIAKRNAVITGDAGKGVAKLSRKKLKVITIGAVEVPAAAAEDLTVCKHFDDVREVKSWLDKNGGVDAVIVSQKEGIKGIGIAMMCSSVTPIPVFILSPDLGRLEESFDSFAEEFLPGKCFETGQEDEMVSALFAFFDEKDSPAGRIREVYSRQLEAASSLDGKFAFDGLVLRDKLEAMLLSKGAVVDWRGDLRKIRDDCFLRILSDYGFLPRYDGKRFKWGAMVDFLADRVYVLGEGEYLFLEKEYIPKDLSAMLRACSPLLNEGSHRFLKSNNDSQWVAIHIVMAVLCQLAEMLNEGKFDNLTYDDTAAKYWSHDDNFKFVTGTYDVLALNDDPSYLIAENVHLDSDECRKAGVKPGDRVFITYAGKEKEPYVDDFRRIVFYTKKFTKVKE